MQHFLEFGLELERGLGLGEGLKYRGLGIELGLMSGLGLGGR